MSVAGDTGVVVELDEREVDPDVEEVRLALALNGGVSLAVWMGGCAVELDRARRTHRTQDGEEPMGGVYQALCDAFRRELVVDVMSGTSAGGINGALLAAALASGHALEPEFLRNRWLELGDFAKLLQPLNARGPTALMRGEYFAEQLTTTFEDLMEGEPREEPLFPSLDITTTDIGGRALTFIDCWKGELHAREHRARFRFRNKEDFAPSNLAAAARASASFPLAFEPFEVPDDAARLAGFDRRRPYVVDGGLLDNAPIRAALELIPTKRATRQVRRLLCYVNGEPAHADDPAADLAEPLPPDDVSVDGSTGAPTLLSVVGVVLNLPRKAPFADQLMALQAVTRNSGISVLAEHQLLIAGREALHDVASALLETYRRRRRLTALEERLDDPAEVELAYDRMEKTEAEFPWLEGSLKPEPGAWGWGIDSARRVHQLALDVIRTLVPGASPDTRRKALKHRSDIDDEIRILNRLRAESLGTVAVAARRLIDGAEPVDAFAELAAIVDRERGEIAEGLERTAESLRKVLPLGGPEGLEMFAGFFGADADPAGDTVTDDMHRNFLGRVIAVDVVRRSFTDDDTVHNSEKISFAQLTPETPDPIFGAKPFTEKRKPSVEDKLCGAILGHFGAFYRRSWRANDFMWGRMDAAARIVEMLVGGERSQHLENADGHEAWDVLARALVSSGPEQLELLEEALADPKLDVPGEGNLESRLREVIKNDLHGDVESRGEITRTICRRAVQFEILCEELRHVVGEAERDLELGCTPATLGLDGLDLDKSDDVLEAVHRLRASDCKLPIALGRVRSELASDMAARTIAHAGLVGLSVSRGVGGMLASPLTTLRSALLPVSGAVSLRRRNRAGVVVAFGACALYLGARIAGTTPTEVVDAGELSVFELLLAVVSLLVVLGTVALPALRAVLERDWRRWLWGLVALLLLTVSGIVSGALATYIGPLSWAHLLVAPGVEPPLWATLLPIALGTGAVASGPGPLRKLIARFTSVTWRGTKSLVLVVLAAALIGIWITGPIMDALSGGAWWQVTAAILALASTPLAWIAVMVLPQFVLRRSARSSARAAAAPAS
ncbi:MAG: patatin-like protein [Solirubrobacteraceae bacterium]|jgi:patatin-related protein